MCKRKLTTKQRVLTHLNLVHNLTPIRNEKKKYKYDSAATVPRSTVYRWRKKKDVHGNTSAKRTLFQESQFITENQSEEAGADPDLLASLENSSSEEVESQEVFLDSSENHMYSHLLADQCLASCNAKPSKDFQLLTDQEISSSNTSKTEKDMVVQVNDEQSIIHENETSDTESDISFQYDSLDNHFETKSIDFSSSNSCDFSSDSNDTDSNAASFSESCSLDSDTETFSNESDSDIIPENSENNLNMPKKEYQALSLLSCFLRNKFSASASKDVIDTLKKTFPKSEEVCALDWDEMLSHTDNTPMHEIHYCTLCNKVFPVEDDDVFQCQSRDCDGLRYKGPLSKQQTKTRQPRQVFVFADVGKQLMDLLQTPGIWEDIQETKQKAYDRMNTGCSLLTDISDGQGYRKLMQDGYLDSNNLTAIFNTDGVNLYSSSKIELWPIFLAINELSPPKRFSRENILLAGMWQGKGKPPFQEYFKVFSEFMNALYVDGVDVCISNKNYSIKLKIVCGTMDLPAKAELLNMSYFNGPYPCITCEEEGKTVKQGKGTARCLPFRIPGSQPTQRKHDLLVENMRSGTPNNRSKGMKGMSGISYLKDFDIVAGIVPDYMHGVCLGIVKSLMCKWFSTKNKAADYFVGENIQEISRRMESLKPPYSIERLPRNLEKHYQHFKATELQSWLLYYALPCIEDFLDDQFLENYSCLSESIYILLGDKISQTDITRAEDLLQQFYSSFERLYGEGSCGLNVHNTGLHLSHFVKLWGPMWCWSCFPFEDINAMLLKSVHGTGVVLKQAMKYRQAQLCIRRKGLQLRKCDSLKVTYNANNCDVAGSLQPLQQHELEDSVKAALLDIIPENLRVLKKVNRIVVNQKRFYSEEYSRMQKRICTVVLYGNNDIGKIKYFVLCEYSKCVYAVLEQMQIEARVSNHCIAVTSIAQNCVVTNVTNLKEVLVFLDVKSRNRQFVIRMPNSYGHAIFK
ncbi:uncharacterized protein LOC134265829 isoform X2 [Saccostrea cucullata]